MRRTSTSLLAALAMLVAVSGAANAYTMRFEPGGSITATSSALTFEGSGISVICPVTLNGTLSRESIELTANRQIGSITEVSIRRTSCSGGSVSGVLSLPWSMTLNTTLGTAPNELTGLLVNVVGSSFNLEIFGGFINCLYSGTGGALLGLTTTETPGTYRIGTLSALRAVELPLHSGAGCPARGHFTGSFTLATTQRVAVSPHELTIEPTRATAEGTLEFETEGWRASCTTEVRFEFETSPIPLTRGARMGTPIGGAVECATAEEVHIEARYLEWGWLEYHSSLIDSNGRFTGGALAIYRVAILITLEPRQKCLFEDLAEVLIGVNGPTYLGNQIALKQDLNAGRRCPGWIRIRGRLITLLELRFI